MRNQSTNYCFDRFVRFVIQFKFPRIKKLKLTILKLVLYVAELISLYKFISYLLHRSP